jgi:arylsulfatase A-like enzyme
MFTGLLPRQLGVAQAPEGTPQSARPVFQQVAERMLGEVLRSAGFVTEGWSTNVWSSPVAGFDIGFDHFEYVCSGRDERMNALLGQGRRAQLAWAIEGVRSNDDDGAEDVGVRLRRSIHEWSGKPSFWFVNLCECHSPYLPPRPWNDLPRWDRIRAALEIKEYLNFEAICRYAAGRMDIPEETFERLRHLYARSIAYMDRWLADVLEALDARGILDETLVIVTSDHGENFGEDGLIAHGFSVNQQLTHMPLVMAGPGAVEARGVFSLAELPRVIAEAAGVDGHPYTGAELPSGLAVAQCDPMGSADDPRIVAFAEKLGADEAGIERLCARHTSVTDGTLKLVVRDGRELFYDLTTDPEETTPLSPAGLNGQVPALRQALAQPGVQVSTAAPLAPTDIDTPSDDEVAAIERQMKLLGYM